MTVEEAKKATIVALGITDLSEVAYITQALLDEYTAKRVEVEKKAGTSPNECQAAGFAPTAGYGTYGNSLVFGSGYVDYKAGPRGTLNYGCGTDNWRWRTDRGDTFTPQANCSGGKRQYLLYCPTCI